MCCIARTIVASVLARAARPGTLHSAVAQPISVLRAAVALVGVCGLAVSIQPADAQPAQVILMRHGHKGSASNNYNLSPIGFQRANALATVIAACYGTPSHVVTYFLDPDTSQNARSYQTAVPLAVASGVKIRIDRSSVVDSVESDRTMLSSPTYTGPIRSHPEDWGSAGSRHPKSLKSPLMSCANAAMPSVTDQIPFNRKLLIAMVRSMATI